MDIPEAIETYLFETGQISALAKRQAHMFSRTLADESLQQEARLLLFLNLAALGRGAPRAPARFLLQPLEKNTSRQYLDSWLEDNPDPDPEWGPVITDPGTFKEAKKILDAAAASPTRLAPITGVLPDDKDASVFPLVAIGRNNLCFGFSRYSRAATDLEAAFRKRLDSPLETSDSKLDKRAAEAITAVFTTDSILEPGRKFHCRQVAAAALAVRSPFLILSGGPGTGKTRVVLQVLRTLVRVFDSITPDRIALCAPTGKAKARLGETIDEGIDILERRGPAENRPLDLGLKNLQRTTLHGLLGMRPDGGAKYNARNPLPHRVIVVDEASMVDLHLFAALMDAASPECRILLVGDMHQLPPVEAGAVLGDLTARFNGAGYPTLTPQTAGWVGKVIEDRYDGDMSSLALPRGSVKSTGMLADRAIILTESHRSVKTILDLSSSVNNGDANGALAIIDKFSGVVERDNRTGAEPVAGWLRDHYADEIIEKTNALMHLDLDTTFDSEGPRRGTAATAIGAVLDLFEKSRILTLANSGPRGRTAINDLAEKELRSKLSGPGKTRGCFYHGQQVILSRNLHDLDLYNGDTGMVIQSKGGGLKAVFRRGRTIAIHSLERLSGLEPAFAITVHKSQGSEFDEVLLVLPERESPLLSRQIVYTGITRAKSRIKILGSSEILKKAIETQDERPGGVALD
jgi:exodeoxyribonuclease V alpha subunit